MRSLYYIADIKNLISVKTVEIAKKYARCSKRNQSHKRLRFVLRMPADPFITRQAHTESPKPDISPS
jgi:hypothetical protein